MKKGWFKPIVVLTCIAVIMAFMLGLVHQLTQEPISEAKNNQELAAIEMVTGAFDNDPFAEKMIITTPNKKQKFTMYPARIGDKLSAVAIKSYTFKVISSHETPGLGSKTDEPRFKNQLEGFHPGKQILKVKQDGGDVDAVTAATISSRAVLRAIERAFAALQNFNTRDNNE